MRVSQHDHSYPSKLSDCLTADQIRPFHYFTANSSWHSFSILITDIKMLFKIIQPSAASQLRDITIQLFYHRD